MARIEIAAKAKLRIGTGTPIPARLLDHDRQGVNIPLRGILHFERTDMLTCVCVKWTQTRLVPNSTSPQAGALNLIVYRIFQLLSIWGRFWGVFHVGIESGWLRNSPGYILKLFSVCGTSRRRFFVSKKHTFLHFGDMLNLKKVHLRSYLVNLAIYWSQLTLLLYIYSFKGICNLRIIWMPFYKNTLHQISISSYVI